MKKKQKQKKIKPFIQKWGTYPNETLVFVGWSSKDILKHLKKIKAMQKHIDAFVLNQKGIDECFEAEVTGLFWHHDGASILWLKEWEGSWKNYETLLHELYHAVHNILGKGKMMKDEEEGCAYQLEYLFREIRNKLPSHK